jgi:hypothetical protein
MRAANALLLFLFSSFFSKNGKHGEET